MAIDLINKGFSANPSLYQYALTVLLDRYPNAEELVYKSNRLSDFHLKYEELKTAVGIQSSQDVTPEKLAALLERLPVWFPDDEIGANAVRAELQKDFSAVMANLENQHILVRAEGRPADNLRLIDRLNGKNDKSAVFSAKWRGGKVVAVKVLSSSEGVSPSVRFAMALQELKSVRRVDHPHVVEVYDVGQFKDNQTGKTEIVLVREYIDGKTLNTIDKNSLSDRRCVEIAGQIAETLTYLLEKPRGELMVLDLKPANVIVRSSDDFRGKAGSIVLIDFGSAMIDNEFRKEYTPGYAPPESALPDVVPTPAWDVFSLGGVLYYLLTGRNPPPDYTLPDLDNLKSVDPALIEITRKCREPKLTHRYKNAGEVARDLRDWYFDFPVEGLNTGYSLIEKLQMLLTRGRSLGMPSDVSKVLGVSAFILGAIAPIIAYGSIISTDLWGVLPKTAFDASGALYTYVSLFVAGVVFCLLVFTGDKHRYRNRKKTQRAMEVAIGLSLPLLPYVFVMHFLRTSKAFGENQVIGALSQMLLTGMNALVFSAADRGWKYSALACGTILILAGSVSELLTPALIIRYDALLQATCIAIYFFCISLWAWNGKREPIGFTEWAPTEPSVSK